MQCRDVRKSFDAGYIRINMIHFRGNNDNVADDGMICILETVLEEEKKTCDYIYLCLEKAMSPL